MPEISKYKNSKYLKKEDFPAPAQLTMDRVQEENVAMTNEKPKLKLVMYFYGLDKGLVLNAGSSDIVAEIYGSTNSDDWKGGKQIIVYTDPDVVFGGKRVGGIRVKAPAEPKAKTVVTRAKAAAKAPDSRDLSDIESDINF